jgi:hypothetical protein
MVDEKHQGWYRRQPCRRIVLALRQLRNEVASIPQGVQFTTTRQWDRIVEGVVPAFVTDLREAFQINLWRGHQG